MGAGFLRETISMKDFNGKTAFVTGAASGLGLAMARAFAARGMNVMLVDLNEDGLAAAAKSLRAAMNVEIDSIVCDVADADAMQRAADKTIERFGKVHVVCNNAGVALSGEPGTIPLKDWRWIVDINLMGVVHGVEIFTPLIQSHGEGGHFVNTASMAGHGASPGMSPYNATKFAVVGYSEGLRGELEPHNIGVSCLCPAWVKTNIHNTQQGKPSGGRPQDELDADPAYQNMSQIINSGLDANDVGEWVADSVEADRLHIFTHPDFKPFIDMRAESVATDYQAIIDDGRFAGK